MSRSTIPAPTHKAGTSVHGFDIEAVTEIPDIKARTYEATHARTGAKVMHVHCNDEENLFSVGFRTPPSDSTGVAHILEHCVLAGSEKYPVKDAFNELGKRTLNTFLNAMTWPDRTVYPVCSAVRADYFNLASVYADVVFNPLITRGTFEREGHHLELEDPENPDKSGLTISGVVYNEMKGVYADPQQVVGRAIGQTLSPDNTYGVDSGGDPTAIPDLTYDDFVAFHKRFYSPTNARFLLYGDINLEDNLAFIDGVLENFDRVEVSSDVANQKLWDAPRREEITYSVGPEDSLEDKTFVVMAWLVDESKDMDASMLTEIATEALVGSAAGPLRKALIDSGLGQDIYPRSPFDTDLRQGVVHFGLRGTNPADIEKVEALILDTLREVAQKGLDPELIEASLHQVAFHTREIVPPFPLMVLMRANPAWYYGGDPKDGLRFGSAIEKTREIYAADPGVFERVIQEKLLDNPHRVTIVATPSNTLMADEAAAFEEKMKALRASMSQDEVLAIKHRVEALNEEQQKPDTPEALATLPTLKVEDIPKKVRTIPARAQRLDSTTCVEHEVFSNGIGYVGLDFDINDLSDEDAILMPLLVKATLGMGTKGANYEEMARRIALHTGGIDGNAITGTHLGTAAPFDRLCINAKVLRHNAENLSEILEALLTRSDTTDLKRLADLIRESATRSASAIIPRGHLFAYRRAAASLNHSTWRQEQWEGITQTNHLKSLVATIDQGAQTLSERLGALQARIFTRARASLRTAGDPGVVAHMRPFMDKLVASLPAGTPAAARQHSAPPIAANSGVIIAGPVNYVGQVLEVPDLRDEAAPSLEMLAQLLSSEVLYPKLRVQGGAYGGFAFYDGTGGLLPMLSYRDPNLTETFDVYSHLVDHIHSLGIDDAMVDASRIGAIGGTDAILSPAQQLRAARRRHVLGLKDEHRAAFKQGLFDVTAADILNKALPLVAEAIKTAPRAALGSQERLEAANGELGGILELVTTA